MKSEAKQSWENNLQYQVPMQVRDAMVEGWNYEQPQQDQSEVQREYYAQIASRKVQQGNVPEYSAMPVLTDPSMPAAVPYTKPSGGGRGVCIYYNSPAGCRRGDTCFFQHVINPNAFESRRPRFQDAGADPNNKTIFIGGVTPQISENEIRQNFMSYGPVTRVYVSNRGQCAFVDFAERKDAERVMSEFSQGATIRDIPIKISWGCGRRQSNHMRDSGRRGAYMRGGAGGPPFGAAPYSHSPHYHQSRRYDDYSGGPPAAPFGGGMPAPPGAQYMQYPSMNPHAQGSLPPGRRNDYSSRRAPNPYSSSRAAPPSVPGSQPSIISSQPAIISSQPIKASQPSASVTKPPGASVPPGITTSPATASTTNSSSSSSAAAPVATPAVVPLAQQPQGDSINNESTKTD